VVLAALVVWSAPAAAENWNRTIGGGGDFYQALNLNVLGGLRILDDADWAPVDEQRQVGLELDYTAEGWLWGLGLVGTLWRSSDEESSAGVKVESTTWEFQAGLRKIWYPRRLPRLYLNGGGSYARVEADVTRGGTTGTEKDSGFGGWAGGGFYWTFWDWLNLGVDARYSLVNVDLGGKSANAGGLQVSALVGWHWYEW
jgi:hypothetical protein